MGHNKMPSKHAACLFRDRLRADTCNNLEASISLQSSDRFDSRSLLTILSWTRCDSPETACHNDQRMSPSRCCTYSIDYEPCVAEVLAFGDLLHGRDDRGAVHEQNRFGASAAVVSPRQQTPRCHLSYRSQSQFSSSGQKPFSFCDSTLCYSKRTRDCISLMYGPHGNTSYSHVLGLEASSGCGK